MLYYSSACEEKVCAHCDEAGDCVKDGNFRGVCPVIGRLNCFCSVKRISLRQEERVGLGRPFFMARSDTHGGADKKQFDRTQTLRKLST